MVLVHFLHELYTYLSLSPPRSKRRFIILVFPYHHTINITNRIPEFVVYTSASVLIMKNVDVTSTSPLTHFEICFKDSNITHFAIFFKSALVHTQQFPTMSDVWNQFILVLMPIFFFNKFYLKHCISNIYCKQIHARMNLIDRSFSF